jgi:4-hydroxy-tetrahydrodipicolinate reductase
MKIALIGYGKMGKAIEQIALERQHEIVLRIDADNQHEFANLRHADVAIEFTSPETAVANMLKCFDAAVPVVCGSTGWMMHFHSVEQTCKEKQGTLFYSSNFSVGVNIFFELNKKLASLMKLQNSYEVSIEEIHHTQKKDAPSGTAISLAEQIMHQLPNKTNWTNAPAVNADELYIESKRIDPAPGTHTVTYHSNIDDILIQHTAHNRTGFATGAVLAAEFLWNKKGVYTMQDMLSF